MTLQGRRICLVSSGHAGSNPRLIKEASALVDAGAQVHVITVDVTGSADVQRRDAVVLGQLHCTSERVAGRNFWRRAGNRLVRLLCRRLFAWGWQYPAIMLGAYDPMILPLVAAAARVDAELFIAHNLAALPAACMAAQTRGAVAAFDAEDFHSGQLAPATANDVLLRLTAAIERKYLPRCKYVTAASPGIARAYADTCGIALPTVVLNVFPLALAPPAATPRGSTAAAPSLFWFSQTIGPDRGLETAIAALALARCRPTLYLQGTLASGFDATIEVLAAQAGVTGNVVLLPPALPDELVRSAAQYDAGLAAEVGTLVTNRDIALTNKVFTYLLAGIPVLASDTRAQAELAQQGGEAIQVYQQHDAADLARCIDAVVGSPVRLQSLRLQAWQLGQQYYNWDIQQGAWLSVVDRCLKD